MLRGVVASLDYFSPKEPRGAGYPERKAEADSDGASGSGPSASRGAKDGERDDG